MARVTSIVILKSALAQYGEFGPYTFEGHTPQSQQWEVVNSNALSGWSAKAFKLWSAGVTDSFEECRELCAKNTSCLSCDWSGEGDSCNSKKECNFFSDDIWAPVANGKCNHMAARKIAAPAPPPPSGKIEPPLGYQPNIVFILSDDQDTMLGREDYTDLGSLEVMPQLQKHLMHGGARMKNAFVNTPICCPSRTEFFSGRMYHNVGPPNDLGSCMHADTTQGVKNTSSMFGLMKLAGYEVGVFGKVTNDQGKVLQIMSEEGSASWIDSPLDYNNYTGATWYHDFGNGTVTFEDMNKADKVPYGTFYQTAQIGNRSMDWLDMLHADPARTHKPFFLYLGPHAPHFPAQPAPWYEHIFDDVTIPITPNYNLSSPDKPQHIRQNPALNDVAKCWQDQHFRDRWASLLSVDDLILAVVEKLEQQKKLENTFIFYTSDHGYKQGQWRVPTSKQHPYETDIRVPMLARGPGIVPGSSFNQLAANIDVAPTILDLAGMTPPKFMDGRSMLSWLLTDSAFVTARPASKAWRDTFLHEMLSVGTYYNDHSEIWNDGTTAAKCGGDLPRGPAGNDNLPEVCQESNDTGAGECWFVDSTWSNSWRALRVMQEDANLIYIEYDTSFKFVADEMGAGLQHYELYDISKDPYQVTNIYHETSAANRKKLHAKLVQYYGCHGDFDSPSTCIGVDVAGESLSLNEELIV